MTKDFSLWDKQFYLASEALKERESVPYIINPLLSLPSLNLVYGISGSLKTNLVIDLAVCVACGDKWLGAMDGNEHVEAHKVKQSPILWIDADSGQNALHQRFGAMLRAHHGNERTPIYYASFLNPPFTAIDASAVNSLIQYAVKRKVKLIVFDNLGTVSGGKDENSAEMIPVMSNLRFISEQTGAAVVVIHHDVKNDNGQRKTPRGHSSIEAALDLALWVKREDDVLTVAPTKTRGAPVDPFSALWTWEHRDGTLDLYSARFYGIASELDNAAQKIHDVLIAHIRKTPSTQTELIELCKTLSIPKHKCLTEIQQLVHKKRIKALPNQAHNRTVYQLP